MRGRRRKRLARGSGVPAILPQRCNQRWSMDFVSDCVARRANNPRVDAGKRLHAEVSGHRSRYIVRRVRMRRVLEAVLAKRGKPEAIVVDNGPVFRGRALTGWNEEQRVCLQFIGRESRRRTVSLKASMDDYMRSAKRELVSDSDRRTPQDRSLAQHYNEERPHTSLGYLAPRQFAAGVRAGGQQ